VAHRSERLSTAASASDDFTAKHTECSEDAWLIMMTLTPASRTVEKIVLAVPCTPTMPVPCTASVRRSYELEVRTQLQAALRPGVATEVSNSSTVL